MLATAAVQLLDDTQSSGVTTVFLISQVPAVQRRCMGVCSCSDDIPGDADLLPLLQDHSLAPRLLMDLLHDQT